MAHAPGHGGDRYVLEGYLEVVTQDESGQVHSFAAQQGEVTRVGPGMSHAARAGNGGARVLCLLLTVLHETPS